MGLANAVSQIDALANRAKRTNVDILRVLKPTSEVLENISTGFHQRLANAREGPRRKRVHITCFIEELAVKRYGMTVMV